METMMALAALFLAARVVKERMRAAAEMVEKVKVGTMVAMAEVVWQIVMEIV
jgi:hypothetical protein